MDDFEPQKETHDEYLDRKIQEFEADESWTRHVSRLDDLRYDREQDAYWDIEDRKPLTARAVDASVPVDQWPTTKNSKGEVKVQRPSEALLRVELGRTVDGSTWYPGEPQIIKDYISDAAGIRHRPGRQLFNMFIPPDEPPQEAGDITPFLDHARLIIPDDAEREHFLNWCAFAAQNPGKKINHGILIAGQQGIGKDTLLAPLRHAIGEWNTTPVKPEKLLNTTYNQYMKSVLLIISEGPGSHSSIQASDFNEQLKPVFAAPPDFVSVEAKYHNPISVPNVVKAVMMTNDLGGMYLPPDDRRLFVTNSLAAPQPAEYYDRLNEWLNDGGTARVARWLLDRDVSAFAAQAPAPMTAGKRAIIDKAQEARRSPVDPVIEGVVETFGDAPPDVLFPDDLARFVASELFDDADDVVRHIKSNKLHYHMERHGYVMVKPQGSAKFRRGSFQSRAAYVARSVPPDEQIARVEAEMARRPLTFDGAGRHLKPV